ncbi:MAG TPA: VWA domain-containing protein [Vicinamibacterales bacterium]|nr:VWA domain-containing protein [Vicinamibacterales bacterium]
MMLRLLLVIALGAPVLAAQQSAPQVTFRASTKLIVTTVVVRNPDGTPVEGLTADDFVVTEDKEPQEIAFVEYQRLDNLTPLPPMQTLKAAALPAEAQGVNAGGVSSIVTPGITVPPSGDGRFRNRRLIILLFDLSDSYNAAQERMFTGASAYLDGQMTEADLVAILTYRGGAVRVKQDFTDDRRALANVIDVLANGEDADGDGVLDFQDFSSAFGQNDGEFNVFSTDRKLAALQTAVAMLRPLPEQKSLVFFTGSLSVNGTDNNAQMRATTNAAIRANVQIFPVDARGLVAMAPLGNANQRSPGGIGMFTGALAKQQVARLQRSQDTFYALAKDTGGRALVDYNDLSLGIRQAAEAQSSYYILAFYSTHTANDGKYRRIQVRLKDGTRQVALTHRQGYFADKEWKQQNGVERERQLEEALMLENPITDITIALELNYFQVTRPEYFVPVSAKIPGSELELARRRGAKGLTLDVLVEVKDSFGATQRNMRDRIEVSLTAANAERLITQPVQYDTGFTLLPGKYMLKFLVRDAEVGRIGTFQTSFTIPNLNREPTRLPISSVVLGSQRLTVNEAIYNVKTTDKQSIGHPLIESGRKLLPSVTRVFSASRDMHVYLEAYEQYAETQQPLIAFATFYREGAKAYESQPVTVTTGVHRTSKAIPVRMTIPLEGLSPGRYDWQVTVIDPTGRKAAFWQTAIAIVP